MRRREFIAGLGGAAVWPFVARAQLSERVRRVGVLTANVENSPLTETFITAFRDGMTKLGWVEGRNLRTELRFAGGDDYNVEFATVEAVKDPVRGAKK